MRPQPYAFTLLLAVFSISVFGQAPVNISYEISGQLNASELSPLAFQAAPKECRVDFHYSGLSARIIMDSPDGQTTYLDRVFPLEVQAFPDSTYVYGKPGAWTVGLGYFENVSAFRVRVVNPSSQAPVPVAVAEGTYP